MTADGVVELSMLLAVIALAIGAGLLLGLVLRRRARPAPVEASPIVDGAPAARPIGAAARPPGARDPGPIRRTRSAPPRATTTASTAGGSTAVPATADGAAHPAGSSSSALVAVGSSDRVCPSCRTTYQDMIYCQRDARRLVSPEELAAPGRAAGLACPRCGRSYEHGLRRCPHDGVELVPPALYQATRRRRASAPTGVLAKVCPVCRRRFDLASRFCGRDGHELVVIN